MHRNELVERIKKAERMRKVQQITIGVGVVAILAGVSTGVALASRPYSQFSLLPKSEAATIAAAEVKPNPTSASTFTNVSLIGKSAIVYDLTNGRTLYAQNAYTQRPLASITKLLTLYAAANVLSPNSTVTMTPTAVAQASDAADAGFQSGERFDFEDLGRLTLAASSNDGAEAIAEAAEAQKQQDTSSLLASAASAVGLTQTYAVNASGLDVNESQSGGYGSAHDIAVLAGSLIKKNPEIAQASTLPVVSATSEQGVTHTFANTDVNVTHYPNLLLSKTGYTDLAGGNLVIVFDAAINHPVAIVVLGSTETGRFSDVNQLMNATLGYFAGTH